MAIPVEPGSRLRRARIRGRCALAVPPAGAVALLYAGAAVLATWPGVRELDSEFISTDAVPGHGEPGAGDHLQIVYRFWLVGHQLARGAAPWSDPYSFQPLVEPQAILAGWPFGFAFWPFEAAFGPAAAWNLLLLGTIVAAGLATYAWLRALDLPHGAAALGGLAFAIAPYRIEQSGGHLLGWIALFLPLALLGIERSRSASGVHTHSWGAVTAASVLTMSLSGQLHLALGALPFVVAYAALRYRPVTGAWVLGGAVAAVVVGIAVRLTIIAGSPEAGGRSLSEVGEFSAEWLDLVSRRQLGGSEDFVFLGWLTPLLAFAGLWILWRRGRRGLAILLGVAALLPPLLALGTNTPLYSALWHALPPLRYPRVPNRFMPVADLAFAALAAFAAAWLLARAGRRAVVAAAALVVLVALDLAVTPLGTNATARANPAYRALAAAPPGTTLALPYFEPGVHYGSVYDLYALQAPRERLNGYSTVAPEAAFDFYFAHHRLSCGVWLPGDRRRLERLGVNRLLFHRGLYEQADRRGAWFAWRGLVAAGFGPAARSGLVTLFAPGSPPAEPPVAEPPRDWPLLCTGWRGRVVGERQATIWLYGGGAVELELRADGRSRIGMWVDGRLVDRQSIVSSGTVRADLGATGWHALLLAGAQGLELGPIRLEAP